MKTGLVLASLAWAATLPEGTKACVDDAKRYCSAAEQREMHGVVRCFQRVWYKLSPNCKAYVARHGS